MNKRVKICFIILFWLTAAGFLIFLCTQDTITNALAKDFLHQLRNTEKLWESIPRLPDSLEEWIDSLRAVCIFCLLVLFQLWLLGCRWRIVRYLPLLVCAACWLFGEYAYQTDGGWGGLILGYMMTGIGIYGILFYGTICLIWHIRNFFRKTP